MVQFFKASKVKHESMHSVLHISRLDHQGNGVALHEGQTCFVRGALAGESVEVKLTQRKKRYTHAHVTQVIQASPHRTVPACRFYKQCGGCDVQHMTYENQVHYKAEALALLLKKFADVTLDESPHLIRGNPWHYRRRARLATLFNKKTQKLQLGFRAKSQAQIVEIDTCPVLVESLNDMIVPLRTCLQQLRGKRYLGHVELLEDAQAHWLLLRVTQEMIAADKQLIFDFCVQHDMQALLLHADHQVEYLTSVKQPSYRLGSLDIAFLPGHFVQVNEAVNQQMVQQAIDWLPLTPETSVLDLFCGVGNFSLPIAQKVKKVVGVEGIATVVQQARDNAASNKLTNISFYQANLNDFRFHEKWVQSYDIVILDPSREGAAYVVSQIHAFAPEYVLYVSCDPVTLARDTKVLLAEKYHLIQSSVMDMFPQTRHFESMLLFARQKP
tara:strand:- start:3291 stop:4616 length:1326 start_codon:yes stop_codon:yes gene_type:complete